MLALIQIAKEDVDSFKTGGDIPSFKLAAKWTKQTKQPSQLNHKVTITGAKKPHNYFDIVLDSTPPHLRGGKLLTQACCVHPE